MTSFWYRYSLLPMKHRQDLESKFIFGTGIEFLSNTGTGTIELVNSRYSFASPDPVKQDLGTSTYRIIYFQKRYRQLELNQAPVLKNHVTPVPS